MRVSQYTAAICTLFVFGCAGHDLLPPAIPEPVSVFFIAAEDLEDFLPRGDDPRRPGLRLITPPPSMLETSASTLDYAAMRKAYRQQPRLRVAAQRTMPERETDAPAVQGVQFAAFPGQGGRAFDSMPTLPDVRGLEPRALPDYAPIRTTPLQRPQRQEKPEKVIADANAASLLSPTRQQYGRGGQVRYPYQEGSAYLVISSPDHPTVMTLPPGERLAVVPAMHPERWDLGYAEMGTDLARQEAIFIRPTAAGQEATTALVTKRGHIYYLKVRSVEQAAMMGVTWVLPDEPTLAGDKPKGKEQEEMQPPGFPGINLQRLHTDYTMEVTSRNLPPWKPLSVFDDGARTVIKYKESLSFTAAPAVFSVHANGEPGVVEWTAYEAPGQPDMPSYYVIAGLWPRLILKGTDEMQVVITRGAVKVPVYQPVAATRR